MPTVIINGGLGGLKTKKEDPAKVILNKDNPVKEVIKEVTIPSKFITLQDLSNWWQSQIISVSKIGDGQISQSEFSRLANIKSNIQSQIDDLVSNAGTSSISVIGEIPSGPINGSNATFTTLYNFIPESVKVYVNGLNQKKPTHFNTIGSNTITLADSPMTGDILLIDYQIQT